MRFRPLFVALGLLELLVPRRVVDFWMDRAVTPESDFELRPWVYTAARIEGLAIVLWALTQGRRGD
ncbi:hypothetical protein ACFR9U_04090 [Halorientalis brevis]|uniref:Uncharacterized protein n=1 Tax=Halorientalis brevis TaxID=1126241 RepID=A0ABD6C788_9EURY|nr:hypothetical protein [Halorientalis brevis]